MKIWTVLVHSFLTVFSREYRKKQLYNTQTKFCIDNIAVMRSKNDHPRDIIARWVEKYIQLYYVDRRVVAKFLLDEQNLHLAELAVKLDSDLRVKAIDQLLDAALAMRINDDTTGSYSSVTAIDFVASAYKLASEGHDIVTREFTNQLQLIISRAAYIAVYLMPEDYPPMLYLKANGFHFRSE